MIHQSPKYLNEGFSLPEVLVTVSILGILSSVATPAMLTQLDRSRQGEAETLISQLMTQASAFNDEFGKAAESWSDLDEIATISTKDGTANEANFGAITSSSGNYSITTTKTNNSYIFVATPEDTGSVKYNVIGCMNVATGASQVISGGNQGAANTSELKC
jgi:type IV pilus assembly protein PilA